MNLPFVLLALAIAMIWVPAIHLGHSRFKPCWIPFAAAAAVALQAGVISWLALSAFAALTSASVWHQHATRAWARWTALIVTAVVSLAMTLHAWPGFQNPMLFKDLQLSEASSSFSQYLNFDKGAVGFILLATYTGERRDIASPVRTLSYLTAIAVLTMFCAFAGGLATGHLRFDPKWPQTAAIFLATNLFFTCVAEEAVARRLFQDSLAGTSHGEAAADRRVITACLITAGIFGLAHSGLGAVGMAVAATAGLGYAAIYALTRRVEAAIAVHFLVNAAHFLLFTYPFSKVA